MSRTGAGVYQLSYVEKNGTALPLRSAQGTVAFYLIKKIFAFKATRKRKNEVIYNHEDEKKE